MEEEQGVDAFFTMPEVAAFCVEKVKAAGWLTPETNSLEPSSGDGLSQVYSRFGVHGSVSKTF